MMINPLVTMSWIHGGSLSYGYPIDENQRLSAGLNADSTTVRGGRWMGVANVAQLLEDGGSKDFNNGVSFKINTPLMVQFWVGIILT